MMSFSIPKGSLVAILSVVLVIFVVTALSIGGIYIVKKQNDTNGHLLRQIQQTQNQSAANHDLLSTIQNDFAVHAQASADRSCASVRFIRLLVRHAPGNLPKGLTHRITIKVDNACKVVIPGG